MIRRLKNDVLDELPLKRRQKIEVPVDQGICKEITKEIRAARASRRADDDEESVALHGSFLNAYRMTGEAKLKGSIEFI